MYGEREVERREDRGEAVNECGLDRCLVGVPNAVEETFPELLHVVVVELGSMRKPFFEEDVESFVAN